MTQKFSKLIFIDRLFSPVYGAFNFILPLFTRKPFSVEKLIVIKFFGMGSIIRTFNVLKGTPEKMTRVELITLDQNREICQVLGVKAHFIRSGNPIYLLVDVVSTVFRVWKMKGAQIIDLERTSNLSGIFRLICGIGKSSSSFTFESNNTRINNQKFISLNDKSAIDAIAEMFGVDQLTAAKNYLPDNRKRIIINVNAGDYLSERKYSIEQFADVVKNLHQQDSTFEFVLTGAKMEVEYTERLASVLQQENISFENTAGKLNLRELIELMKSCRMLITNDSGPLHLAYYFNVPTVAIWGPTSPKLVGYPESDIMKNVSLEKECSPCFFHPKSNVAQVCAHRIDCLRELSPSKVVSAALSISNSLKFAENAE